MSEHFDPNLAAIERRLDHTLTTELAPALRHRVLMAVDDVLANRQQSVAYSSDVTVPGWAWAMVAAVGVAIIAPVVAGAARIAPSAPSFLAARLEAAGVADDPVLVSMATSAGQRAVSLPPHRVNAIPPARQAFRVIDMKPLLEENL